MSRVSNNPISIPSDVAINIAHRCITIKGPLGSLQQHLSDDIAVDMADNTLRIRALSNTKLVNAFSGTLRALIANMIKGVSVGFERKLQLVGVGYRAQVNQNKISLSLGYSHSIDHAIPAGIVVETPTQTEIIIKGIDKQKVGQLAADIRAYRKPEPYKGKGIRYSDEVIILKETKKK